MQPLSVQMENLRSLLRLEPDTDRACRMLLRFYRAASESDRMTLRGWLDSLACRGANSGCTVMRYRRQMDA